MRHWFGWASTAACFAVAIVKLREGDWMMMLNYLVFGGICWGLSKVFLK
jgi:hypothetical protein